jgi:ribulose-5-phosphate 4-epimerase/fuculose-1-phosphate aldolase
MVRSKTRPTFMEVTVATVETERPFAPPLPALSPRAELALLARLLHVEGYDDHLSGHLSYKQEDGSLLVNPFGLTWDEIRPSDVMRISPDGDILDGPWTVTPAIELHLALHRARPDVVVGVHNHSRWGTIWADLQRVPPIYDQTSAMVDGQVALFDAYDGDVAQRRNAEAAVTALGDAKLALLANHGVFVVGDSIRQAHQRAITLEWRCRQAWHVEAVGGGVPLNPEVAEGFGSILDSFGFPGLFEAMVRRELRRDPSAIDE